MMTINCEKNLDVTSWLQDDYISMRVYDRKTRLWYWLDVHIDDNHDLICDFNQYIFSRKDEEDIARYNRQSNCEFFEYCDSVIFQTLLDNDIIRDTENGQFWNRELLDVIANSKYKE